MKLRYIISVVLLLAVSGNTFAGLPDSNWIKVAPSGRYLMFEDGSHFIPLGVAMGGDHINFDYFGTLDIDGKRVRFDDNHFDRLFRDMRANNENYLRIDIEGTSLLPRPVIRRLIREGKIQFLEEPAGSFNESYARRIDRLLALAEQHAIYLSLVLITHTCDVTALADNFDLYSYHRSKGGPLRSIDDLFRDPDARRLWRARMKYISGRWGHSRHIAAWELYNELLNCGGDDAGAAAEWVREMGTVLRDFEKKKYGKSHPVIVSTDKLFPEHRFFYDSPSTDLMVVHYYSAQGPGSGNPIQVAKELHGAVTRHLDTLNYRRPFLTNERTLGKHFSRGVQQEMEHAAAWSLMASGAAGPGASWVRMGAWGAFRTKDVVSDTHRAMHPILETIDFAAFDSRPMRIGSDRPQILPMAVGDGRTVLGWVLHDNPDDYDIENIRAWLEDPAGNARLSVTLLLKWLALIEKHAPAQLTSRMKSGLEQKLQTHLHLDPNRGRELAEVFWKDDPKALRSMTRRLLAPKGRELSKKSLAVLLEGLRGRLVELERQHGILRQVYRSHPTVTGRLTVKGLTSGPHRVTWYDDNTGHIVEAQEIGGERIVLRIPRFRKHLAFVIR